MATLPWQVTACCAAPHGQLSSVKSSAALGLAIYTMEWGKYFSLEFCPVENLIVKYFPASLIESIIFINIYNIRYLSQKAFQVQAHIVFSLENPASDFGKPLSSEREK